MRYLGQSNYVLSTLIVTLLLSDSVILKYIFSFLKILDISETQRKKALKRVKTRAATVRGRGGTKTTDTSTTQKKRKGTKTVLLKLGTPQLSEEKA